MNAAGENRRAVKEPILSPTTVTTRDPIFLPWDWT